MDVAMILQMVVDKVPVVGFVFMGLGALVILGQAYVAISPSKDDDAFLAKVEAIPVLGHILKALASFAPIQKK